MCTSCVFFAGLSGAWVGFCVNLFVTVVVGLALQFGPRIFNRQQKDNSEKEVHPRSLDIGKEHDPLITPWIAIIIFLMLLFTVPFYWPGVPLGKLSYVGNISAWAFTSLFIAGKPCGLRTDMHCTIRAPDNCVDFVILVFLPVLSGYAVVLLSCVHFHQNLKAHRMSKFHHNLLFDAYYLVHRV